jgi:hypothetical protein
MPKCQRHLPNEIQAPQDGAALRFLGAVLRATNAFHVVAGFSRGRHSSTRKSDGVGSPMGRDARTTRLPCGMGRSLQDHLMIGQASEEGGIQEDRVVGPSARVMTAPDLGRALPPKAGIRVSEARWLRSPRPSWRPCCAQCLRPLYLRKRTSAIGTANVWLGPEAEVREIAK